MSEIMMKVGIAVMPFVFLAIGYAFGRRGKVPREFFMLACALARKHEAVIAAAKPIVGKAIQIAQSAKLDGDVAHFKSVHSYMGRAIGMADMLENNVK